MIDHADAPLPHELAAILDGRQTQFRRLIEPQPPKDAEPPELHAQLSYQIGDRILVLEDCAINNDPEPKVIYQHDDFSDKAWFYETTSGPEWTSYIWAGMPRWASRLTLIVTDVRVQRLHEITLGEICAEGLARTIYDFKPLQSGFQAFEKYWDGLHGEGALMSNPWVVAVTFTTHHCNIDHMEAT